MNHSFKVFRCPQCFEIFNSFQIKNDSNCDSILEEDYNESLLKSELLMLSDYLMSDKMGEALFLLGRIIGNLENGEYVYGSKNQEN